MVPSQNSCLQHCHHPPLDKSAKQKSEKDMSQPDKKRIHFGVCSDLIHSFVSIIQIDNVLMEAVSVLICNETLGTPVSDECLKQCIRVQADDG